MGERDKEFDLDSYGISPPFLMKRKDVICRMDNVIHISEVLEFSSCGYVKEPFQKFNNNI